MELVMALVLVTVWFMLGIDEQLEERKRRMTSKDRKVEA